MKTNISDYDFIIVGAGLAGLTMADLLANKNKKVLVIEKRNHIGGNCYDEYNHGILVHKYGPHAFHTNNKDVWGYLSNFTIWNNYKHRVLVSISDKEVPLPINLKSIELLGFFIEAKKLQRTFKNGEEISIFDLVSYEDNGINRLADYIYSNVYFGYSKKQWGIELNRLDQSVLNRIKIRMNYNDNYFTDIYQGIPKYGYTKMFKEMIAKENIDVLLNTDYRKIFPNIQDFIASDKPIIFTGMLDELFDYCYGELPYQSLKIKFENKHYKDWYYQECAVVNYPNLYSFTRITEYKHFIDEGMNNTVISKEYPEQYKYGKNQPYYPILTEENNKLYKRYKELVDKIPNLYLIGRLAEYKYYNMDQVVERALRLSERILNE